MRSRDPNENSGVIISKVETETAKVEKRKEGVGNKRNLEGGCHRINANVSESPL